MSSFAGLLRLWTVAMETKFVMSWWCHFAIMAIMTSQIIADYSDLHIELIQVFNLLCILDIQVLLVLLVLFFFGQPCSKRKSICNFTKQSMSKLRVAFNNVYRLILGFRKRDSASCMFVLNNVYRVILGFRKRDSASCMFVSSRIDSFEAKTRKTCYTFRQRMTEFTEASEQTHPKRTTVNVCRQDSPPITGGGS